MRNSKRDKEAVIERFCCEWRGCRNEMDLKFVIRSHSQVSLFKISCLRFSASNPLFRITQDGGEDAGKFVGFFEKDAQGGFGGFVFGCFAQQAQPEFGFAGFFFLRCGCEKESLVSKQHCWLRCSLRRLIRTSAKVDRSPTIESSSIGTRRCTISPRAQIETCALPNRMQVPALPSLRFEFRA